MIESKLRPRLAAKARLRFDKATQSYMLLYPERGMKLNATASSILRLCDGQKDIATIIAELSTAYGRSVQDLTSEVDGFLQAMVDRGLVEWST